MEGKYTVPQKGVTTVDSDFFSGIISAISCYSCILPLVVSDFFVWQFQFIYFGIHGIPKIDRREYLNIDRHLLSRLNFWQKVNCVYCAYANGVAAYTKAVINQMEIYSCAIKHSYTPKGHEHHTKFYSRKKFE